MRWPLVALIVALMLIIGGVMIHVALADSHPYHSSTKPRPSSKPSIKPFSHPLKASSTTSKPSPKVSPVAQMMTSPSPKPISPHNLLAADTSFLALADKDCVDINSRVLKANSDYHVGMWWFQGPDKRGKVTIYCRGFLEDNGHRLWFELNDKQDGTSDTLYVRT